MSALAGPFAQTDRANLSMHFGLTRYFLGLTQRLLDVALPIRFSAITLIHTTARISVFVAN